MELNRWLEEIKQKGNILIEMGKLRVRKASLERKISKFYCRLGERVDYLDKIGKSLDGDEILKGLIEEIRAIEKEIEEIDKKLAALGEQQLEEEGGDSGDKDVS